MVSQHTAWFKIISTTDRSANTLARRHGYGSVEDLAKSLPSHAKVLDVGAGASTLGREIAKLRPDIHWTNLDFSYHDKQILEDVSRGGPANLKFIAGDVTKLDDFIGPASMDAIFSYWLFPHLTSYDQQVARTAAKQLYDAAKSDGILIVGPRRQPMLHPDSLRQRSWRIRKATGLMADEYSHEIVRQTNLTRTNHFLREILNEAAYDVFATS